MKIHSTFIAILALFLAMHLAAENYSGKCGADLNWTLDTETGVLDITGSGDMYNASIAMDISWYSYRNNITSVNLPNGLTSIGSYAFYGCEKLTNVDIPNTVSVLGFQAFCNCSSLSNITIPDGLTYINVSAFSGCSSLTSLTLPKSVTKIFDSAFCFCSNITSFTFGDAVTYIGPNAFQDCSGLDSLVLPASITEIRNNAFSGCTGLTSITCHATNPPAVNYYDSDKKTGGVFYQVNKSIPLYVPEESIEAYQTTEQWKDFTNIHAIPKEPTPKPVYLVPDRWATDDGDKFAVWGWKGTEASGWSAFMTLTDDGRAYQAEINEQYTDFYISRFASSVDEPNTSASLDQTKNIIYDADKPVCYATSSEYVYYTRKYSVEQHTLPFWRITYVDYDGTELNIQVVDDNATPSAPSAPSHEGLSFTGWDKEIVAATADATYKATYSVAPGYYTLTVKPNIADWGNVDGSGVYKNGATAMITAVPASGYQFSKWSDGSNENPREVVVSQDSIITAIFQELVDCEVVANGTCGENLTWEFCSNGTLVISGTGEMTDYTDTYEPKVNIWGATVTERIEVYAPWYEYRTQIIKLIIEDGVTSIGYEAFEDCTALTTITIPSTLQDIDYNAFYNCSSLSIVYWNAKNMSSPTHYSEFPNRPFSDPVGNNMSPITTIVFGESVERIPAYLCSGHTTLKSVTLPNSVIVVEPFAFRGCTGLTEPIYNNKVFAYMPSDYSGEYTIPDGIVSIAGGAFSGCSSITSITLPESVTEIGYNAFYDCTGINSPVYNATIYARCPITMEGEYSIPEGTKKIGSSAFANAKLLTKINIPNSIVEIGEEAFYKCEGLSSLDLPTEIASIGNQAFQGCKNITDVVLGDSLKSIGDRMFYECENLQTITFKTQTPPTLSETLPKYIYKDEVTDWSSTLGNISCTVYVPCSSVAAYKEFLPQHASQITCSGEGGGEVLTVAEAITRTNALADNETEEEDVTVEGFVVNAEKFNPLFKNQIFYLSDDASNSGAQRFQAHFCRAVENGDTVPVINGDKVRLTGKLKKYIDIDSSVLPEIHLGTATFVSKVDGDRDLYKMSIISVSQALTFAADLQTNETGTTEYIIHGFVTSITENTYNTDYKSMTFWMADEKNNATSNAEDAFYVYRGKPDVELQIGDEVYVDTKLKNYNGTIESETGVSVRFIEPAPDPADQRTVTLKVNNSEWGTVSGGGTFYNGDTITITATPNDGYVFVSWSNGDTNAQTQFVVGGNVVIIAQFAPLPQAEPIALNMNAVEIDYYPSYNSDKGYDYFLLLYTIEDNAVKVAPLVAFDIYTSVHKDFAGEYNLAKDNVEVKYGAARIPSTSDGGYDEYDLSDAAVTITINADNSYTLTGYITVSTGQVYNFEVTDNPYYCDVEHENEPETPKTLNLTMVSGEINMQYIDKGKIYLNFLTADSCKVVLSFGTADSTAVDIKDGTYSITQNTKETFWAGRSYNSNVYYSYAAFGDDRYYLTSGSVTITTITAGRFISVNASSYYGSQFKFTYLIENPAEQKYSIFVFANDSRLGTVSGGGQYVAGTQVTLTATPANGSRFEKWSNGSTENTLTITVTSEATYVAIFKAVVSSTSDETGGYNQYDVKGGVVEPWTNESGHLPQNTDSTEDNLTPETSSAVSVKKIMRDGQLYILRNGGTYNAQGARVE